MDTPATGAGAASGLNANSQNGEEIVRGQINHDPTLLQEINERIEMHAQAIARLSKLKDVKPDYLLRMRMSELRALAYLDSPI